MLTVVCVFAMVLGGLGLLTSAFGAFGLVFGRAMMQQQVSVESESPGMLSLAMIQVADSEVDSEVGDTAETQDTAENGLSETDANNPDIASDLNSGDSTDDASQETDESEVKNGPPDMSDMMAQNQIMQEAMMKVQDKWFPLLVTFLVVKVIVCLVMSVGGLLGVLDKPLGRTLMMVSFIGVILLEAGQLVPNYQIQQETSEVVSEHMGNVMDSMPGNGPKINMGNMMKTISAVQTVISASWGIFKIGLFAWFFFYLRKSEVVRYFQIIANGGFEPDPAAVG